MRLRTVRRRAGGSRGSLVGGGGGARSSTMRSRRLEADDGGMSEGVIFFVIYVVAIVFILFMLWGLMRVAHAQMIPKWKRRPNDSFRVKNGHSWDYVLVFKVYDASEVLTKEQKKYSVRKVVERITSAGCETKMFFAVQRATISRSSTVAWPGPRVCAPAVTRACASVSDANSLPATSGRRRGRRANRTSRGISRGRSLLVV